MKAKLVTVAVLCSIASGCATLDQLKFARTVACEITTEQGRAEIRQKQKLSTDICGDLE